jgi:predicted Zn finger-like uncharacterized protein
MTTGMVTRCPACDTVFRVTPEQLQARAGKVRCGRCMTVFDGAKALAAVAEGAQEQAALGLEPTSPAPAAPRPARPAEPLYEDKDFGPAPRQLSLDDLYPPEEPRPPASRWWAVAAVLMVFLLAAQAAYSYRSQLATRYPGLKPHLVQLCEVLRCKVLPPNIDTESSPGRSKQIEIEASDLQVDPALPGIIQLTATLRNHAGYDLAYPAVDLVLTDTKEHTLARRIFLPQEYVVGGKDIAAGIPTSAEITVRLVLDTGNLNPAGFRLALLPAPAP